jgi:hypothetical protein
VDTRIPTPLISTHIANMATTPSLGKLVDLRVVRGPGVGVGVSSGGVAGPVRSTSPSNSNSWRVPSSSGRSTTPVGGQRGWAVVAKPPSPGLAEASSMPLRSEKSHLPTQTAGPNLSLVGKQDMSSQGLIPDDWEED